MDHFPVPVPLDHHHHHHHHQPQQQTPPPPSSQQQQPLPQSASFLPAAPIPSPSAAAGANPTPALNHNHPPYAEMIYAAITALKEKDGSSRIAIAKYIEQNYSNLPPTHSAMLTHYLKKMKNSGHLLMVKKSYMLPRSDAPVPVFSSPPPAALILPNNSTQDTNNVVIPSSTQTQAHGPKTGRGRGRPPKNPNAALAQPILVSVGLVDQIQQVATGAKRGRGRPKKSGGGGGTAVSGGAQKVMSGRRPGRPKKLQPVRATTFGPNGVAQVHAQVQAEAQPISFATSEGNVALPMPLAEQNVGRPRGRGRPKKLITGGTVTATSKPAGRPAGRPVGRPKRSKSRFGRPLGRPRKVKFLFVFFENIILDFLIVILLISGL